MAENENPIVSDAEKQEKILNALQAVLDPEIGLSVIDLDLIRNEWAPFADTEADRTEWLERMIAQNVPRRV